MVKKLNRLIKLWLPVVFWAGLIFVASSLPVAPASGRPFFDLVMPYLAHVVEFGGLFVLFWRAVRNPWLSFLAVMIYALSDEWHQSKVPTRTPSWLDFGADCLGAAVAWGVVKKSKIARKALEIKR